MLRKSWLLSVGRFLDKAGAVLAFGLVLCASVTAQPQNCEDDFPFSCDPPSGHGVHYVCSDPTNIFCYDPSSTPMFTPDRRPVFWLPMFKGEWSCDNPKAHADWWNTSDPWDGAANRLKDKLDDAWEAGFRRIILVRPGGRAYLADRDDQVLQATYQHLTTGQKGAIQNDLKAWIEGKRMSDPEFQIGVYVGSRQSGGTCTPCIKETDGGSFWLCDDDDSQYSFTYNYRYFDPTDSTSMTELYENLKPWMDIGCDMFGIDNTSRWDVDENGQLDDLYIGPRRLLDLMQSDNYDGIQFIGEAAPWGEIQSAPGYHDIDVTYATYAPWVTFWEVLIDREWLDEDATDQQGPANSQTIDPASTELGVAFPKHVSGSIPNYSIHEVADARDRGFLVWARHENVWGFIQRLYDGDYNEFYMALSAGGSVADFDFDGDEDCQDFCAFITNWGNNYFNGADDNFAVWDGDIDNNDDVDCNDLNAFLQLRLWNCSALCPQSLCV